MSSITEILEDDDLLTEVTDAVFQKIDKDHSGTISKTELRLAMCDFAKEVGIDAPSDESVDEAFETLDADGSGSIDKDEFKELIRQLLEAISS